MTTATIPSFLPEDLITEWELERSIAEDSLADFLRQAWHVVEPTTPLTWGPHLDAICEHLEAVTNEQIRNLLITIAPGSTKSIACGVIWPVWSWVRQPGLRWLMSANEFDIAIRDAVASRRLVESEWFRVRWGHLFKLTSDQNTKGWYENDRRGYRTTTTVGSSVTGKKGDILFCDDPHDSKKVESEVERHGVHDWWDKAFFNRVNNHITGRRVVIGQRTHEDDLQGHILATGGFEHLNIPEEFDPSRRTVTSIGWTDWRTDAGQLMRPERFGQEQVREARARLGSRGYAAQHNQNPLPVEGSLFKAAWFKYYHIEETHYLTLGNNQNAKRYHIETLTDRFLTVDHAATVQRSTKHDPDYTVIAAWLITPCGMLVWLGCWIARCEVPDIPPQIAKRYLCYGAQVVEIESGGTQKSVAQYTRRHQLSDRSGHFANVVEFVPNRDKLDTANAALVACEAGRVWFPGAGAERLLLPDSEKDGFPLVEVEGQLLRFTGGKQDAHDDVVTVLSMAAKRLTRKDDGKPGGRGTGNFRFQAVGVKNQRMIR